MSVLLTMDNFPGSLEWPPLDEPGVLGRAPVLSLSPTSSALLSGANTRCLPIPCGGQDHRGGLGPDRQSGSTTLSLQPGKLCVGPDTGGREPLEGNHWVGAPHCPSPIALGSFDGGSHCYGLPEDMLNGRGMGLYTWIKHNRKEGRKVVTACPVAVLDRK